MTFNLKGIARNAHSTRSDTAISRKSNQYEWPRQRPTVSAQPIKKKSKKGMVIIICLMFGIAIASFIIGTSLNLFSTPNPIQLNNGKLPYSEICKILGGGNITKVGDEMFCKNGNIMKRLIVDTDGIYLRLTLSTTKVGRF